VYGISCGRSSPEKAESLGKMPEMDPVSPIAVQTVTFVSQREPGLRKGTGANDRIPDQVTKRRGAKSLRTGVQPSEPASTGADQCDG